MYLQSPASYLTTAQFRAQANDQDLTAYTDSQLQDILTRASSSCDSFMGRSFQPQEITELFEGDGSNVLDLANEPLIYVRSVELIMPGYAPFQLPLGQLLIDYQRGSIRSYSPMIWQSLGVSNVFPRNGLPIAVNYAFGRGWPIAAPSFTLSGDASGTLENQSYDVTVTSRTQSGESLESAVQAYTPTSGAIVVSITPSPGAFVYRVYAAVHGGSRQLVAESPATNYGTATMTVTLTSLDAPANLGALTPPTTDTSAWPLDNAIIEATRLYALSMLWEQNNLANRGVYVMDSGGKRISYKPTDGMSGKGISVVVQAAQELLKPYQFAAIS